MKDREHDINPSQRPPHAVQRTDTFYLVDLAVYIVPPDLWREHLQCAANTIVDQSISAGFIRVLPDTNIYNLREELDSQVGFPTIPRDYVFLKLVGRHLTRLRPKQEFELRVKNFLPPKQYAPEIFLLEVTPEMRATFSSSGASSVRGSIKSFEDPYRLENYRSPFGDKPEFNRKTPLPAITNGFSSPKSTATQTGDEDLSRPTTSKSIQTNFNTTPLPPIIPEESQPLSDQDHIQSDPNPFDSSRYSDADSGDAPLPPLSASPPASPEPPPPPQKAILHHRGDSRNNHAIEDGENLPPLSATPPPDSPVDGAQEHYRSRKNPDGSRFPDHTAPDRDETERLEAMRRQQEREEESRRRELEQIERRRREAEEEEERRRREWAAEEEQKKNQEKRRLEEERYRLEEDERRRKQYEQEQLERIRKEREDEDNRRREEDRRREREEDETRQRREEERLRRENAERAAREGPSPKDNGSNTTKYPDRYEDQRLKTPEKSQTSTHENKSEMRLHANLTPIKEDTASALGMAPTNTTLDNTLYDNPIEEQDDLVPSNTSRYEARDEEEGSEINEKTNEPNQLNDSNRTDSEAHVDESKSEKESNPNQSKLANDHSGDNENNDRETFLNEDGNGNNNNAKENSRTGEPNGGSLNKSDTKEEPESEAQLNEELERLKRERKLTEKKREDLVRRAKQLQNKTQTRRNAARDAWKKKYFDEKKKTPPLEDQANKLKQELDQVHRKIMSSLEASKDKSARGTSSVEPSQQGSMKIQATKLQHDNEDLQRKVDNIKMKLTSEMKLRNQAETELRALRAELTQKKINVTLARQSQQQALAPGLSNRYTPGEMITPRT